MNTSTTTDTNNDYESHPNIDSIYNDMMEQASPVCSPIVTVPREHVKTFTVSTKLYDGAEDDDDDEEHQRYDEGHHTHHHRQQQRQQRNNNTYIITTKTFDGCVAPSSSSSSSSPTKKKKCFLRKNSTDSAYSLSAASGGGGGGGGFSRKNSTDSSFAAAAAAAACDGDDVIGGQQQQTKKSKKSKKNWRDTRRSSTDSTAGLGLYNDDELWTQRIGEIMNRGFGGGGVVVEVPSSVSRDPPPTPVDGVKESVRMVPPPPPSSSSSSSSRSRCRSTDDYLSSQSKNKSGGGGPSSFSRRGSMEMDGGRDVNNNKLARKNSRSTSPKFIPPIDTFGGEEAGGGGGGGEMAPPAKRGFTRRNSMTRSRSPKFVEPLTTTDHDESRVFQGRLRRHTMEGPNPFTTRQLETLRESVREKRAEELSSSGCDDYDDDEDESSSVDDDNIAEMVRRRLEGLEEPSTPTPPKGDEEDAVPRKPFSRHNSIEGVVDTSIFPSLPSLEQKRSNDEADPNFDLAMLFQHLVDDNIDDDDDDDDDEDLIVGEDSDDDDEDGGDDNIIKRHSKIRRRCSTGGLRTFERENLRNFLEDNEGDDDDDAEAAEAASRRRSFFKRCSTGGLRTLQRENSRDMYSDDSSLDGKRGRVPLADDNSSFEKYLRKMTQEAVVDTSEDVHIIEDHVNRGMARNLSREDSDDDDGDDNIIKRHSKIRRRCSTGGLRTFEREDLRNFLEDNEGDDDDDDAEAAAAEAASRRRSLFKRCSTGGLRTLQRENSRDMYSDDSSLDGREGRLHLADDKSFEKYLQRMTEEAVVDTSEDVHIIEDHVGRGMPRRSSIRSVSSAAEEENSNDFAAFISRVGMGAGDISSSQTVATVSTAANTSYAEDSHVSRNEVETVRSSAVKKTYPHSIHMPNSNGSSHNESVSSLDNSNRQGGGSVRKVNVPTKKTSSEVHFKSSKSRSIRRLASKDGIDELKKFADGLDAPAQTRRASGSAITEPVLEDIVLKDLPDLIKDIDRDLVTERAVYRKRQSGDASTGEASILSEERKKESGVTVQFNLTQARKNLEPAGTSAGVPDEDGLQETRKQDLHFMEESFLTTDAQSNYIRKGSVDQQRGEIPPVPVIALGEIPDGAAYQPKRRRSSTRTEDRQRSGKKSKSRERSSSKQGKPLDEKRRKELAKNSPFRNNKDGSSLREGSIAALKGLRRKLSSGKGI